ncbi:MAG: DUF58 domain-containing protein [Myxococcota bacterium]|nr:DUF58 domain-containing protein [Myxococcota bacterium]
MRLRGEGRDTSFLPRQPLRSQLAGLRASRLRGRGLDFEELRAYRPGDDVRDIDWKATARTRRPHTRVYTAERDRPTLLLVDQRLNMFFGSRRSMKSVAAARAAALAVWRVLAQGDRPGAIVFNDRDQVELRPHRSQARALAILDAVAAMNRALSADARHRADPGRLNRVLEGAARLAHHDHLVILVSDLDGLDAATPGLLDRITRHNDLLVLLIFDPLERTLPDAGLLVVSDGELQLEVDARDRRLRGAFTQAFQDTVDSGRVELHRRSVPMLPIHTAAPVAGQLRQLLGHGAGG